MGGIHHLRVIQRSFLLSYKSLADNHSSAQFSWFGTWQEDANIKSGQFECYGKAQRNIRLGQLLDDPQIVLTWISGLDASIRNGKVINVTATGVRSHGFTINVDCANGALNWTSISWIALAKTCGFATGKYQSEIGAEEAEGYCPFEDGLFHQPPQVLTAMSSLDMNTSGGDTYCETHVTNVTTAGFEWKIYSCENSSITHAGFQWLAIPAR